MVPSLYSAAAGSLGQRKRNEKNVRLGRSFRRAARAAWLERDESDQSAPAATSRLTSVFRGSQLTRSSNSPPGPPAGRGS